jgi:hypothetical protein
MITAMLPIIASSNPKVPSATRRRPKATLRQNHDLRPFALAMGSGSKGPSGKRPLADVLWFAQAASMIGQWLILWHLPSRYAQAHPIASAVLR